MQLTIIKINNTHLYVFKNPIEEFFIDMKAQKIYNPYHLLFV
jgi:hypothetical protein